MSLGDSIMAISHFRIMKTVKYTSLQSFLPLRHPARNAFVLVNCPDEIVFPFCRIFDVIEKFLAQALRA